MYICLDSSSYLIFKLTKLAYMSKFLIFPILFIFLLVNFPAFGQDSIKLDQENELVQDTIDTNMKTEKQMPFRKGRVLLGASIYISSESVRFDTTSRSDGRISNDYSIEVRAGYFVIDKFLVGGLFRTRRLSSTEFISRETESFQFGSYLRYYLAPNSHGGVFIQGEINFTLLRDEVSFNIGGMNLQRLIKGNGLGTGLGVGYSYSPFDRMSMDMSVNYNLLFGRSEIQDLITGSIVHENFIYNQILFGLSINVIL